MKRVAIIAFSMIFINLFFVDESAAKGRGGSRRRGGGSAHYVGGYGSSGGGYSAKPSFQPSTQVINYDDAELKKMTDDIKERRKKLGN